MYVSPLELSCETTRASTPWSETMMAYSGSWEDAAPMLRLLLMGASQSAELHKVDTITPRSLDNVGDITWEKTENFARKIKDDSAREYYAHYRLAAVPLDIAIAIGVNNEPTPATRGLGPKWRYTALDRTYQMVPIHSSSMDNPWALAYVAAHYHSSLWQGRTRTVLYTRWQARHLATKLF